jgi:hypothetical protein
MSELEKNTNPVIIPTLSEHEEWFGNLISTLRIDQLKLETGTADEGTKTFYHHAIAGNYEEVLKSVRKDVTKGIISTVVIKFLKELNEREAIANKLAFCLTPAKVRVWVEINDDDEVLEDKILLAEAKVNVYAREFDMSIDTMIVEESDRLGIPAHYIELQKHVH